MLLECDRKGQVIWMSERTRSLVGTPATLAEILDLRIAKPAVPLRVRPVLRAPEGLLLAAEAEMPAGTASQQPAALRQLEQKLLSNYFRLLRIERRLSEKAARKRPGAGQVAIRQVEVERRRIASELHTGVGQMLAAMRMQLELVTSNLNDPPEVVRQALANLSALSAGALDQVRSVSRRLHPPDWQRLTIVEALRQLWMVSGVPLSFDARLDLAPLAEEPALEIKTLIYRTAQEGLSNIAAHSQARKVAMSLESHGDTLTLTLQDDGVGFDATSLVSTPSNLAAGIGLQTLAEQASAAGAKLQIESGPNGTKLILTTLNRIES
jgi:signal transduction histidine kinase